MATPKKKQVETKTKNHLQYRISTPPSVKKKAQLNEKVWYYLYTCYNQIQVLVLQLLKYFFINKLNISKSLQKGH